MTEYLDRSTEHRDLRVASAFDQVSPWSARFGEVLLDNVPLGSGLRWLDLGCGTGFPLIDLAHMVGPGHTVVGADVWREAMPRIEIKREVFALDTVHAVLADGVDLPFPDATFDRVVSNVGVNNFADAPAALAECARVLRAEGRLALTTNTFGHMRELYALLGDLLQESGHPDAVERLHVEEAHRAGAAELRELLGTAGLTVTRELADTFPLRFADGGALLRHALTVYGFLAGWRSAVPQEVEREIFTELERRLDQLAAGTGEVRMTVPRLYLEAGKAS